MSCTESVVRAVLAEPDLLTLHVQPIIEMSSATVAGYEALSRLPDHWGIGPEVFFTTATARGLGAAVSRLVLERACELRDSLPDNCFLTVNLAPADLSTPEVASWLATARMHRMIVELTEREWPDEPAVLRGVELIRAAGAWIAADDVGAGYAGLLQLVRLRPQLIKVDRSLVSRLAHDPAAEAVVAMLGNVASTMDAWVLAEGVETLAELQVVARLGVPLAQGWFFGRADSAWPAPQRMSEVPAAGAPSHGLLSSFGRAPALGEIEFDDWGRPVAVMAPGGLGRTSVRVPAMTMADTTPPRQALERALARKDPFERFTPLCITAGNGALVAVVSIDALAGALAAG